MRTMRKTGSGLVAMTRDETRRWQTILARVRKGRAQAYKGRPARGRAERQTKWEAILARVRAGRRDRSLTLASKAA
jgi:hypothetical protein